MPGPSLVSQLPKFPRHFKARGMMSSMMIISSCTVDGCKTLHHQKDGWNPINNGGVYHLSTGAGFYNHPPYMSSGWNIIPFTNLSFFFTWFGHIEIAKNWIHYHLCPDIGTWGKWNTYSNTSTIIPFVAADWMSFPGLDPHYSAVIFPLVDTLHASSLGQSVLSRQKITMSNRFISGSIIQENGPLFIP